MGKSGKLLLWRSQRLPLLMLLFSVHSQLHSGHLRLPSILSSASKLLALQQMLPTLFQHHPFLASCPIKSASAHGRSSLPHTILNPTPCSLHLLQTGNSLLKSCAVSSSPTSLCRQKTVF
eukprot:1159500-Pelagomonas_calceolata.AAC.4